MISLFNRFAKDESGATAIEYGLIAALISVVGVVLMDTIGTDLNTKYSGVSVGVARKAVTTPVAD
jgi:pilus assembly protein Flp/PilA